MLQSGLLSILNHNVPFLFSPNTFEFSEFDKTGLIEDHHQIGSFNWNFVPDKYMLDNGAGYYAQFNPKHLDEQGNETTHYPVSNHNSPYAHKKYADHIIEAVNSRLL